MSQREPLRGPIRTSSWSSCWQRCRLTSASKMAPTAPIMTIWYDEWFMRHTLNPCQQLLSLTIIYFVLFKAFSYLKAGRGPNSGPQKVTFYKGENVARDSLSVCPSADTLGSVHSPALRCAHNEVSERLEDVAGSKHVKGRNSLWILKQILIMFPIFYHTFQEADRKWQQEEFDKVTGGDLRLMGSVCSRHAGTRRAEEVQPRPSRTWSVNALQADLWRQERCSGGCSHGVSCTFELSKWLLEIILWILNIDKHVTCRSDPPPTALWVSFFTGY